MTDRCYSPVWIHIDGGACVLVDEPDAATVASLPLKLWRQEHTSYARIIETASTKPTTLHHAMACADVGQLVDHINGDGLDNRRANLRVCSRRDNNCNASKAPGKSSRYKGVSLSYGKWRAAIRGGPVMPNGWRKGIVLGYFSDEEDAARAYDAAAVRYFGEFARLNFPGDRND